MNTDSQLNNDVVVAAFSRNVFMTYPRVFVYFSFLYLISQGQ